MDAASASKTYLARATPKNVPQQYWLIRWSGDLANRGKPRGKPGRGKPAGQTGTPTLQPANRDTQALRGHRQTGRPGEADRQGRPGHPHSEAAKGRPGHPHSEAAKPTTGRKNSGHPHSSGLQRNLGEIWGRNLGHPHSRTFRSNSPLVPAAGHSSTRSVLEAAASVFVFGISGCPKSRGGPNPPFRSMVGHGR